MEIEEAFKVGCLLIPPQSFLRKTWIKRYCALYSSSKHGIQRVELFESEDAYIKQNPSKIIPLTECIKVSPAPQKQQPNVFEVRTKNAAYQFSAETFQEMSDWLSGFQFIAFGKNVSKKSTAGILKEEKQEENLLYSSMDEPEIYPVKAVATEATLRNKLVGDYKLIITPVNLSIAEDVSQGRIGKIILTWPYRHIRRYGCSTENFSFEAGRKCSSGEGLFSFATNDRMIIFQSVDAYVFALKSSQNESEAPNSPSLHDDKGIFFVSKDSLSSKTVCDYVYLNQPDKVQNLLHKNEEENELSYQNKTSTVKSFAPVTKPPRKSKSKSPYPSNTSVSASHTSNISNEDKYSHNIYEEVYKGNASSYSQMPPVVDKSDESYITYERCSLSLSEENALCSSASQKINLSGVPKQSDNSAYNYENCDPLFHSKNTVPKLLDHVYGKLVSRQSAPVKERNAYGSILPRCNSSDNTSSPMYSNVPFISDSDISDDKRDPDHFVKNDAEYAQVFKKSENLF